MDVGFGAWCFGAGLLVTLVAYIAGKEYAENRRLTRFWERIERDVRMGICPSCRRPVEDGGGWSQTGEGVCVDCSR